MAQTAITWAERRPARDDRQLELTSKIADHRRIVQGSALSLAARTTSTTSAALLNHDCTGLLVLLSITAASGSGGLRVILQNYVPATAGYGYANAASALTAATGGYAYLFSPVFGAALNLWTSVVQVSNAMIASTFKLYVEVGDATSYTYALDYYLIP